MSKPIDPDFARGWRLGDAKELANALGVCTKTITNWCGLKIHPVKIGSARRYHYPSALASLGIKEVALPNKEAKR